MNSRSGNRSENGSIQPMKTRHLAILTIGQSPRDDVVPVLQQFLPERVSIHQVGALDELDDHGIANLAPRNEWDGIETRLRTGQSVVVSKAGLDALLVHAISGLHDDGPVLFLCSSAFPAIHGKPGIIQPNELILPIVRHVASGHLLGVIGPESDLPRQPDYWHPHAPGAIFAAGSPHSSPDSLRISGAQLMADGATILFLDCMGFSEDTREMLSSTLGIPVLCATTLVGRLLAEFI